MSNIGKLDFTSSPPAQTSLRPPNLNNFWEKRPYGLWVAVAAARFPLCSGEGKLPCGWAELYGPTSYYALMDFEPYVPFHPLPGGGNLPPPVPAIWVRLKKEHRWPWRGDGGENGQERGFIGNIPCDSVSLYTRRALSKK